MRIAYLGDVVGTPGRHALAHAVPILRGERGCQIVVANAENAADGSGLTPELFSKIQAAGVDAQTLGDHAFRKQQIRATLETAAPLVRPANLPKAAWGRGRAVVEKPGLPPLHVILVLGRVFMDGMQADDPFAAVERELAAIPARQPVILEVHAEATSEKAALAWHFNGRVAAVVGTHTHVPTADARLLSKPGSEESIPGQPNPLRGGTAFISDLGMCGPVDSILGRRVDRVVKKMSTGLPALFDVALTPAAAQGVIIDIHPDSGLAASIERFTIPHATA